MTLTEVVEEQGNETYCADIPSSLNEGEELTFREDDQGVLIRAVEENEQIIMPEKLQRRILHISHNDKTAGQAGGRKMYYTLHLGCF